jgi:hypothetical protein
MPITYYDSFPTAAHAKAFQAAVLARFALGGQWIDGAAAGPGLAPRVGINPATDITSARVEKLALKFGGRLRS